MSVLSRFAAPQSHVTVPTTADKFIPFIETFLADIASGDYTSGNRTIKLLAHSHDSAVTRALIDKASELEHHQVKLELILADLPVSLDFETFLGDIDPVLTRKDGKITFRWAQNKFLLDAHEQMILGDHSSWSGDTLKRVSSNSYHIDMFETDDVETIRLGEMAFSAMWMASSEVPFHRLKRIAAADGSQKKQFFSQIADSLKAGKWAGTTSQTQH